MPDLADARWFAADLHVPDRRFGMLHLDEELVERSSFLDTRLEVPLASAQPVAVASVAAATLPSAPVGWLFHTSFCASTLLARALHVPGFAVALKEPLVLRRLSDARKSRWPLEGLVEPTVKLLARSWHPDAAIVIKPTHVALNIAGDLLAATPDRRAMILTSSLDDFLISNLKKPPESQAKIGLLVERALRATRFGERLPALANRPPDMLGAAGLQWAAQREHVLDLALAIGGERLRVMDARQLLDDLADTVWKAAQWLQLPAPRDALIAHAIAVAARNAKALDVGYGPAKRAREAVEVAQHYRHELARARSWLAAHVLPAMRAAALADPPRWQ